MPTKQMHEAAMLFSSCIVLPSAVAYSPASRTPRTSKRQGEEYQQALVGGVVHAKMYCVYVRNTILREATTVLQQLAHA